MLLINYLFNGQLNVECQQFLNPKIANNSHIRNKKKTGLKKLNPLINYINFNKSKLVYKPFFNKKIDYLHSCYVNLKSLN